MNPLVAKKVAKEAAGWAGVVHMVEKQLEEFDRRVLCELQVAMDSGRPQLNFRIRKLLPFIIQILHSRLLGEASNAALQQPLRHCLRNMCMSDVSLLQGDGKEVLVKMSCEDRQKISRDVCLRASWQRRGKNRTNMMSRRRGPLLRDGNCRAKQSFRSY
jgi:hypothetical protein